MPPRLHRRVRALVAEQGRQSTDVAGVANEVPELRRIERARGPRFRAVVAWGRRHEPWLVSFEPPADPVPLATVARGHLPSLRC